MVLNHIVCKKKGGGEFICNCLIMNVFIKKCLYTTLFIRGNAFRDVKKNN